MKTAMNMMDTANGSAGQKLATIPDDREMLRAAVTLTKDIAQARPGIYWPDFLGTVLVGYGALALTILSENSLVAGLAAVVAILTLYRAVGFIHELTHLRPGALPGFRLGWNLIIGIPLLVPSFMYEGVHTHHHAKTRYGTVEDPEYLPLALMKPWSLPLFIVASMLAPVVLLARFAILIPLGALIPPLRRIIVARYSALAINPAYSRQRPKGEFARQWVRDETAASIWAIALLALSAAYGWRPLLIGMAVFSGVGVVNQLRTLVAHLWENDGETMTVTGQYLDSVNIPPPSLLAPLWAPVGLRYHALHHLLPSMPYHSLGEAHRRLMAHLGRDSTYNKASYSGMFPLIARIARSTMGRR